jgi:transposase
MVEPEVVRQIRVLGEQGWGAKRIAAELGIARNTVRRYVRGGEAAERQVRPNARRLDEATRAEAVELFETAAGGNAVVVRDLLADRGTVVTARTVQRLVQPRRQQLRAEQVATVRFETAPGAQMQIDFGQKRLRVGGVDVVVHFLVAVLSYSRRLFVQAFSSERQDDWREGIARAFRHFGGVPRTILGDNARALVVAHDRSTQTVTFHPAYAAFCKDWGVVPRACAPYRARTKGKSESGVKFVKRNGLAERDFDSFAHLERHLVTWTQLADQRVHGTTKETPLARFERDERHALQPLPQRPLPSRERRLLRRVAHDTYVDVDTVRYSAPHRLVREHVEVAVGEQDVRIFHGSVLVATHERSREPHAVVTDPAHHAGLWRATDVDEPTAASSSLASLGRSLAEYADVITAGAA